MYVIDPDGVDYFRKNYNGKKGIKVIYINSTLTARYERMKARAEKNGKTYLETVDISLKRITNDIVEFYDYIHNMAHTDFTVENNDGTDIDAVADKVYNFICSCEGMDNE